MLLLSQFFQTMTTVDMKLQLTCYHTLADRERMIKVTHSLRPYRNYVQSTVTSSEHHQAKIFITYAWLILKEITQELLMTNVLLYGSITSSQAVRSAWDKYGSLIKQCQFICYVRY